MTLEEIGKRIGDLRKILAAHIAGTPNDGVHTIDTVLTGYVPTPSSKKTWAIIPHAGSTAHAVYTTINVGSGTPTMVYSGGKSVQQLPTGSTSGNSCYLYTALLFTEGASPDVSALIKTDSSVANLRIWFGFFSTATFASADDPKTGNNAALRFSAGVDTNFSLYVSNGANSTVVDTGVAVAADTEYTVRLWTADAGTTWNLTINGVSVNTTTNVPSGGNFYNMIRVDTKTNAGKALRWSWIEGKHG